MATTTLPDTEIIEAKPTRTKPAATKYVYFFGGGKADGNGKMKDVLGGKGAGLAEMTNAGLARASRLHHSDRGLPRIHAPQRGVERSRPPDAKKRWPSSKPCRARSSAKARTRCW